MVSGREVSSGATRDSCAQHNKLTLVLLLLVDNKLTLVVIQQSALGETAQSVT